VTSRRSTGKPKSSSHQTQKYLAHTSFTSPTTLFIVLNFYEKHMVFNIYLGLIAAAFVGSMALAPVLANAVTQFIPNIQSATAGTSATEIHAKLKDVASLIPRDGSGMAFGYGLLTSAGLSGVVVTTTHQGICDSNTQSTTTTIFVDSTCSPVFHNHFVILTTTSVTDCAPNTALTGSPRLEVQDLTYQSPGKVVVKGNTATLIDIPSTFTGTSALDGDSLTITPGTSVAAAVGFTLHPVFVTGSLTHVCVENVAPHSITVNN
jgi:hypothetical protein